MDNKTVQSKIQKKLDNLVEKDPKLSNAYLLIHSDKQGIHWSMSSGHSNGKP